MCNTLEKKLCTKCGEYRDFNQFQFRIDRNQYSTECYPCRYIRTKDSAKQWVNENKEVSKEYHKIYNKIDHLENKEKHNKRHRENWEKNKEIIKIKHKIHYKENKPWYKEYRQQNKEKNKLWRKAYVKNRKLSDPIFKLTINTRSMVSRLLNGKRSLHTYEYIGCTSEQLWLHLEKQFRDGMTRENYGKVWHVDHIIPLSFFKNNNLVDITNLRIANHWGNLQPLLVQENLSKGDNIPEKTNFTYFD